MPRLRKDEILQALVLLLSGTSVDDVARQLNCHRHTISRLGDQFQQTGDIPDRPRSGRPKVTRARQDHLFVHTRLRQRFKTASSTALELGVSSQTVLNWLKAKRFPIRPRWPYICHIITRRNHNLRLRWARHHYAGHVLYGRECSLLTNLDSG